jgi:stearoyl-CoA desaturase (Delta-9 desaturase)
MRKIDYSLKNIDPFNTSFLIILPILGVVVTYLHVKYEGFNPYLVLAAIVMYGLTIFSISGGYHRLFSHRAYKANSAMKLFYLIFGAASGESTAVKWASDHRVHHQNVDTDKDPYNIHQGFFYAHIGWVFLKESATGEETFAKDLTNDKLVMWQHRNGVALMIGTNVFICLLLGWLTGDYLGAAGIVGFLRLTVVHHITFCINSLCHMIGTKPYDDTQTARDSNLLAFLTFGESYHNYHHSFQTDYRNGHLWYQWDPTKWILHLTTKLGWSWDLKRANEAAVLKARMNVQQKKFEKKIEKKIEFAPAMKAHFGYENGEFHKIKELKEKVHQAHKRFLELRAEYYRLKHELQDQGASKLAELKQKIEEAKREFQHSYQEWLQSLSLQPAYAYSQS